MNYSTEYGIIYSSDNNPAEKVRFLNGVLTGGYATLRKEVAAMKKYILRTLFFIIVFIVLFQIKAK